MKDSQRAWDLAMVLIANGKIPFDPANPSGSVKILSRHLDALETALHEEAILADTPLARTLDHEHLHMLGGSRPALVTSSRPSSDARHTKDATIP
jgi:hypothetical protein